VNRSNHLVDGAFEQGKSAGGFWHSLEVSTCVWSLQFVSYEVDAGNDRQNGQRRLR
jgi:hypothetical protein